MQRKVLDSLIAQGSLVGVIVPKNFRCERLENFAQSFCGTAPFLCVEYSPLEGSPKAFLEKCRVRQHKNEAKNIFVVFRKGFEGENASLLFSMRILLVFSQGREPLSDELLSALNSFAPFPPQFFWWCAPLPPKKRFPALHSAVRNSVERGFVSVEDVESDASLAAATFLSFLKIRILRENVLDGWPRFFRRFFPLFCVLAAAVPFFISSEWAEQLPLSRNIKSEMLVYAEAPYFDYVFDGKEPLERIARYAVGRFSALVTNAEILDSYIAETLEKNGFPADSWRKNSLRIPPAGVSVRFSIPDSLRNPEYDLIAPAWNYFTGLIADSIAYVTEAYYPKATSKNRKHPAWDVASRPGARILAPFSGKAWTFQDERGGVVIGIADKNRVILFMHCNQLLYLDGQNVMRGDPVATVGTTGHTTGPHVHLVTGFVDVRGKKKLGNIRYTVVNPITWFLSGK